MMAVSVCRHSRGVSLEHVFIISKLVPLLPKMNHFESNFRSRQIWFHTLGIGYNSIIWKRYPMVYGNPCYRHVDRTLIVRPILYPDFTGDRLTTTISHRGPGLRSYGDQNCILQVECTFLRPLTISVLISPFLIVQHIITQLMVPVYFVFLMKKLYLVILHV